MNSCKHKNEGVGNYEYKKRSPDADRFPGATVHLDSTIAPSMSGVVLATENII